MDRLVKLNGFSEKKYSVEEVKKVLTEYDQEIDGFIIYGCGPLGNHLKYIMEEQGLNVLGYVDDFAEQKEWLGLPIRPLELWMEQYKKTCYIITTHYTFKIKQLRQHLLESVGENCNILDKNVLLYIDHGYSIDTNKEFKNNIVQKIDCIISNRCTLRCKSCSVYIPYIEKEDRINFPAKEIERDMDAVNDLIDYAAVVELMGGEPFLHPELPALIDYISGLSNVYLIMIDTNGTILPDDAVFEALRRSNGIVHITDYGDQVSIKKNEIIQKCREKQVHCTMRDRAEEWYELGLVEYYGDADSQRKYDNCVAAKECIQIYKGGWYLCPRDFRYRELYKADSSDDEWLDLNGKEGIGKKRDKVNELINRREALQSCSYCKGTDGETVPWQLI